MSHDLFESDNQVSRRGLFGLGLAAGVGALFGLGVPAALAQKRGGGGSSAADGGSSGDGGKVIPPGTPANCIAGTNCPGGNPPVKTYMTTIPDEQQKPKKPKKLRRRRVCDGQRINGKIDRSCRNPD